MIRDRLLKTIHKFKMIEKGETVLVGVSGGRDSITLLHVLAELRAEWKLRLGILHVNHKLRGEASEKDEAFVRKLGQKLNIPTVVTQAPIKNKKLSIEEAAREKRYQFFEKQAEIKHAHRVAVAHTQDDQAETVLMRVILGTGLQGLQAIRPKRKLNGSYLVRPLIEVPRAEIEDFVRDHKIRFREDASNRSMQFLRNRIRKKLIPTLEKSFNPQVKRALARLPHLLDVDLAFLEETAELFYKRLATRKQADEVQFPKQSFLQLRPSIQYRLLGRAMRVLAEADLDFDHWNVFLERLTLERRFRLQFPKKLIVSVSPDLIRLRQHQSEQLTFSHSLVPGDEVFVPEINATLVCERVKVKPRVVRKSDQSFELLDARKLLFPLMVRNRRTGDRFQPLGQSKPLKLKGFLINKHIPSEDRDRLPLILSGNSIAWVGGVAMGEAFKVNSETSEFVKISMKRTVLKPA